MEFECCLAADTATPARAPDARAGPAQYDHQMNMKPLPPGEESPLRGISCTRALLERVFRRRVLALRNLTLRAGALASRVRLSPDGARVVGACLALCHGVSEAGPLWCPRSAQRHECCRCAPIWWLLLRVQYGATCCLSLQFGMYASRCLLCMRPMHGIDAQRRQCVHSSYARCAALHAFQPHLSSLGAARWDVWCSDLAADARRRTT